jgi:ADP-ribose pyrophosphatase
MIPTSRPPSRQPLPEDAKRVFKGALFDVYQWQQQLFNGTLATFEKLKRPDTAYVIPVTADGRIVLSEQKQPGSASYVGLIGGRIEEGEPPELAAKRELREEAGFIAQDLVLWETFQFLPKLEWAIFIYIATSWSRTTTNLDAGERVNLLEVSVDQLVDLAAQERFGDVEVALKILRTAASPEQFKRFQALLSSGKAA